MRIVFYTFAVFATCWQFINFFDDAYWKKTDLLNVNNCEKSSVAMVFRNSPLDIDSGQSISITATGAPATGSPATASVFRVNRIISEKWCFVFIVKKSQKSIYDNLINLSKRDIGKPAKSWSTENANVYELIDFSFYSYMEDGRALVHFVRSSFYSPSEFLFYSESHSATISSKKSEHRSDSGSLNKNTLYHHPCSYAYHNYAPKQIDVPFLKRIDDANRLVVSIFYDSLESNVRISKRGESFGIYGNSSLMYPLSNDSISSYSYAKFSDESECIIAKVPVNFLIKYFSTNHPDVICHANLDIFDRADSK